MRKKTIGLLSLAAPALIGALATSCDKAAGENPLTQGAEALCGPCGKLETGDIGISGNAKFDGFFSAVAKISDATGSINADFDANITSLSETFGVDVKADANIKTKVNDLVAAIKGEFSATLDGGVEVKYTPAECHASLNVAVEATAQCEAKAECDVKANPGKVEVECSGSCTGSCTGKCEGALPTCELSASAKCEGKCEGTCTLDAAATCEGSCHGTCEGECSVQDANGQCAGKCEGMCTGSCEFTAAAMCNGTCSGKCEIAADAKCEGGKAPSCSAKCEGKCDASCTGDVTPPSASVNCEATADCQAQAKAQANASLECTPPSIGLAYKFKATADAKAQADFVAHLGELKARGGAILQGFTKYELLIKGNAKAGVKSPVAELSSSISALASADASAYADIPPFRFACAIDAFGESISALATVTGEATANLEAQTTFATAFTGGFK